MRQAVAATGRGRFAHHEIHETHESGGAWGVRGLWLGLAWTVAISTLIARKPTLETGAKVGERLSAERWDRCAVKP